MSAEYSVDAAFDAWVATLPAKHWAKYDISACRLGWEAQKAERIKADEGVVPVAWQFKRRPEDYPDEWSQCSKEHYDACSRREGSPWIYRELFDRPPAQAAQVDAAKSMKACPEHQVEMLMARAVASGVVIPDAPPTCPLSLSDIVKLIVNSYPVAAIVREMDAQAPGIRGAFAPLAPTADPAAQGEVVK